VNAEADADPEPDLSLRDRAILRAVAEGRAELAGPGWGDLMIDGRCCADQTAARRLIRRGLIDVHADRTARPGRACLTSRGRGRLEPV
jgi:hypothetical protein